MTDKTVVVHDHRLPMDIKLAIFLYVVCIAAPAVMAHPTFWSWVVTGIHAFAMVCFYYVVKHIGRRTERERIASDAALLNSASPIPANPDPAAPVG